MNKKTLSKEQAISMLKWSIEAGVDEALNETTGYRFIDQIQNNKDITDIEVHDPILPDNESSTLDKGLINSVTKVNDEKLSAATLANQCHSVSDIITKIKDFPHFKLYNKNDVVAFYNGSIEASVLIFKEPEIYSVNKGDVITSDAKKLLFNKIFDSINKVLSDGVKDVCGSIVTFPEHFDSSEEAKDYNFELIRPFLIRYVKLIKPQAIIFMGGFLTKRLFDIDSGNEGIDFVKRIEMVTFPSLDVLLRAPKRKKDVWNTILDLKIKLKKEE